MSNAARETGDGTGTFPATLQDAVDMLVERHESPREAYAHLLTRFKQGDDVDTTLAAMSDMKQRYPEVRVDE